MDEGTPERWLPVPGYEGLYEVSSHGGIRSLDRTVPIDVPGRRSYVARRRGRMLRQTPTGSGYLAVSLSRGPTQTKTWTVHTLVALAFIGPRPPGHEVCHNDGNPMNNNLSNLRYDTISGNRRDAVEHGTHRNTRKTHCPSRHKYTPENTYMRPGTTYRQCRICMEDENEIVQARLKIENDRLREVAANHRRPWTGADLQVVASHPDLDAATLAAMLGRTRQSVKYARRQVRPVAPLA